MGSCFSQTKDLNKSQFNKVQTMPPRLTKSSMQNMLVGGLIANSSETQIRVTISWNQHKLEDQFIAKNIKGQGELGLKKLTPEARVYSGGQYKIQKNMKKYNKTSCYMVQPRSIKKLQIKRSIVGQSSIAIEYININNEFQLLDNIQINCIEDLRWLILNNNTSQKMIQKQYEFINRNYQLGYYDHRNKCQHKKIAITDQIEGCFSCLKLKQKVIGRKKWYMCQQCNKTYCQICYQTKKRKQIGQLQQQRLKIQDKIEKLLQSSFGANTRVLKRKKNNEYNIASSIDCLSNRQQNPESPQSGKNPIKRISGPLSQNTKKKKAYHPQ